MLDSGNWRTTRSSTPRSGFGPSKSEAAKGRWTAPPKGAAEFVGRGHSTVVLDLRRWLERGFEGLADGGPLCGRRAAFGGARFAGCGWGSPKNHPRGRRVSDITCTARYVRNELLAQDSDLDCPPALCRPLDHHPTPAIDGQRRRRSGPGTFPSASLTRKRLKCSGLKRTAAGGSWGGRRRRAPEALGFGRLDSQG